MRLALAPSVFLAAALSSCSPAADADYECYALVRNAAGNPTAGVVVDLVAERRGGDPFATSNFYTSGADGLAGPLRFGTKLSTDQTVFVRATARASGVTNTATVTYDEADARGPVVSVVVPLTVP